MPQISQRLAAAVDHRHQRIAGLQAVGHGERLAEHHLAPLVRAGKAPVAQEHAVELRLAAVLRQRNDVPGRRFRQAGQIERDIHHHAGFHRGHAGQRR